MAAGRRTVAGFWRDAAVRSSGHSVGDPYGRGLLVFYGFSLWHLGVGDRYRGENLVRAASCVGRVEGAVHSVAEEGERFYTEKREERRRQIGGRGTIYRRDGEGAEKTGGSVDRVDVVIDVESHVFAQSVFAYDFVLITYYLSLVTDLESG